MLGDAVANALRSFGRDASSARTYARLIALRYGAVLSEDATVAVLRALGTGLASGDEDLHERL
ncbi:MAG: hypothetical protein IAI50_10175, partial [Candidatus Eremiobacteraeota bacterium]|nr:hypothetical protein [Candidatus Eremiobacteraeota bacterium]